MPRTYDAEGFRLRAAALLFRADGGGAVLLVHSSKRGAARWVVSLDLCCRNRGADARTWQAVKNGK